MSQLTRSQIEAIRAMSGHGVSEHYIRNVFGIGRRQLRRALEADLEQIPATGRGIKKSEAAAVDTLLAGGLGPSQVAERLAIPVSYAVHRQRLRAQAFGTETSTDSSCPKFADHEACTKAVLAHGGFPRAERIGGRTLWLNWRGQPWKEVRP